MEVICHHFFIAPSVGMKMDTYSCINFFGLFSLIANKYDIESIIQIRILVFNIELVKIHKRLT
jgi:hypothetical protein